MKCFLVKITKKNMKKNCILTVYWKNHLFYYCKEQWLTAVCKQDPNYICFLIRLFL